jgi:hypothetical protein
VRRFRIDERRRAIRRGLDFLYRTARDPPVFDAHGSDLLNCFSLIASTSADRTLRRAAREMGAERARRWRRSHPAPPADADAGLLIDLVYGSLAAGRLGVRDRQFEEQLRAAVGRATPGDFLWFDPKVEPPPSDVPEQCECGLWNERGRKSCRVCRRRLSAMTRYKVWYYTLMLTYTADRHGFDFGARYADALKWLPEMRPYRGREGGANEEFYDTAYAVTHVVYTLNDYSVYQLSPAWLPEEFRFLKANLREAAATDDPEMMGEFLDALRAFGLTDEDPLVRFGLEYLLSTQRPDGGWVEAGEDDLYLRYHPTWTALDGLREYRWRGRGLSFPQLLPTLKAWAKSRPPTPPDAQRAKPPRKVGVTG